MTRGSDTSLDGRGLRLRCPEGHPIYWHAAMAGADYRRSGLDGGICTQRDVWDQDASHMQRPGRLRRAQGESPLLAGMGCIRAVLVLIPGQPATTRTEVLCRRGHALIGMAGEEDGFEFDHASGAPPPPDAVQGDNIQSYMARLVPWIEHHGWTYAERVECAEHRAERLHVERELAQLAAPALASVRALVLPGAAALLLALLLLAGGAEQLREACPVVFSGAARREVFEVFEMVIGMDVNHDGVVGPRRGSGTPIV